MSKMIKIVLGICVVIVIGIVSYFIFVNNEPPISPLLEIEDDGMSGQEAYIPENDESPAIPSPGIDNDGTPGQGAYIPEDDEIIRVLFPVGGEKLEIGKSYEIRWENFVGSGYLTISLEVTTSDKKAYTKIIASDIPGVSSGTYEWTVTSEPSDSKYKIGVYPADNRVLVGRSKNYFSITGDSLIIVNNPKPLEKVTDPIRVSGKARRIFSEGEFMIKLRGWGMRGIDDGTVVKFPVVAESIAHGSNCDWMSGDWCDFEVELSVPSEELKDKNWVLEFYQRDERFGEKLIYEFLVVGEQTPPGYGFLQMSSPLRDQEVVSPIVITGKAKDIFVDGKFRVALWAQDYSYGHPKGGESRLIDSTYVAVADQGCNWAAGAWCDFKGEIDYQSSEVGKEGNTLNFYRGGEGELGEGFLLTWPIEISR